MIKSCWNKSKIQNLYRRFYLKFTFETKTLHSEYASKLSINEGFKSKILGMGREEKKAEFNSYLVYFT